nr:uncharacterized protein LOC126517671 [Dermacentor andersoni]
MKSCAHLVSLLLVLADGTLFTNAKECNQSENMLVPGHWYQYEFHIKAEAASVGSTDDVSEMNLACQIKLSHIGTCKYVFEVQECAFSSGGGPAGDKELWTERDDLSEMTKFPVVMSLSDGVVTGLEVSPSESEHILNIKRALISAFVLKKSHMREGAETSRVDIHGTCPWKMWPGTEPGMAHSSKDMLYCAYPERPDWNLSPWAFVWNLHFIQYLINSTVDCTYRASAHGDHLESLSCHERHAIKLESTHDTTTAVQTNVFYNMLLKSRGATEASSNDLGDLLDLVPAGIAFKHLPTPDPTQARLHESEKARLESAARNKLAELVSTAETDVRLFTIPLFHEFIELLREMDNLLDFVDSVANCDHRPDDADVGENLCTEKWKMLAMSFLKDALIQSNTVPTLHAFRHLVTHGHVSQAYLPLAFHCWSFLRNNDTRYLEEVFEICKSTEHRMCWLLLGRMVRKYHTNNEDKNAVLPVFDAIFKHITAFLGRNCDISTASYPPLYTKPQKINHLIMMLKALKNAGAIAQIASRDLEETLMGCAQNRELPIPVAVFAIEAMHDFWPTYDALSSAKSLLGDRTRPWELRIAVYKFLTREPDRWKFGKAVSNALDGEPHHSELVDYVVSDFLDSLPAEIKAALEERKFDTDSVIPGERFYTSESHDGSDKIRKSNRRTLERHIRLPFLPAELSDFAVKIGSEEVYGGWRNLLSDLSRNVSLQLFGTEFHFADITVFLKEIEQFVLGTAKLKDGQWRADWEAFFDLLLPKGGATRLKQPLRHFPKLQEGLKKILDAMPPVGRMSLTPVVDLSMFGTDLTFSSYGEIIAAFISAFMPPEPLHELLRQPRSFNIMRTIRVIEGYHQVPTMLGLSLNWTTSATLVTSLRTEAHQASPSSLAFKVHPSGALTFLNRMVLDFPTKTRMGVQANSSAYTTTQLNALLNLQQHSAHIEVEIPSKEQKILQLIRTNQMIKHDRIEEMGDWNVQRVNVDWCTGDGLGHATGLQFCHDRSYVNVTHLMRPWFLMAAPASWQFVLKPYSKDITALAVTAVLPSKHNKLKIEVITKATVPKNLLIYQTKADGGFELVVPDMPFLKAAMKKRNSDIQDGSSAVVTEYVLGYAPGQHLVLIYEDRSKQEQRQKPTKEANRIPSGQRVTVSVRQRSLNVQTNSNTYGLSWTVNTQSSGVKQELRFNFERGPDGSVAWLRELLADEFFTEDGSGGWVHVLLHWKVPTTLGKHKVVKSSHSHVSTPKTSLDLTTYFLESRSRHLLQVNLTKLEKATRRLLAFANYTQEHWMHMKGDLTKRNALYNLTISHHSWALKFEEESRKSSAEVKGQLTLLIEKMQRRQSDWEFFSTWWHPSTSHLFEAKHGKTKLLWLTRPVHRGGSKKGLHATALEATLQHHAADEEPFALELNGNLTLMPSGVEVGWLLGSPNSDLKWEVYSKYAGPTAEGGSLPSEVTYLSTIHRRDKPFGAYRLQVRSSMEPCLTWELRHNITSEPWLYTSNVTYACDPLTYGTDVAKSHMNVTVFSKSPIWELLNMDLNQVFELGTSGYESMNLTSAFGKVVVTGQWDEHSLVKESRFTDKSSNWIPLETVYNEEKDNWIFDVKLTPRKASTAFKMMKLSKRSRRSGAAIFYDARIINKRQDSDPQAQELNVFQAVVVPRNSEKAVRALANEAVIKELLEVTAAYTNVVIASLYNPRHPFNLIVYQLTGATAGEIFDTEREKVHSMLAESWKMSHQVLGTFHAIYDPVIYSSSALVRKAAMGLGATHEAFKQTIPGWAFYYFNLDRVLNYTAHHIPELSAQLATIYFTRPARIPGMVEFSADMPSLPSYGSVEHLVRNLLRNQRPESWSLPRLEKGQKVAAIFGSGHVVTFDGVFLEFPSYPASYCTYLLAHDVGGRQFTLTTSADDLLIDFPEVALTISGQEGRVLVNGSDALIHLPLVLGSGQVDVYREGHLVRVRGHGLTVYCDATKFFCTFVLDQFHHGNLLGTLGNADGNAGNEYELPNGQVAKDAAQLAAGYEMSGYAECRALLNPIKNMRENTEECRQRVPQTLKHCLMKTNMEELFQDACSWDVSHRASTCTSVNAMAAFCTHHGYWVDNLHCDHCLNSPEAQGQKTFRVKSGPLLEVVVLLAESSFDPRVATLVLAGTQKLVDAVDASFKAHGHNTKYAFVLSGGGHGHHYRSPHLRTTAKDVFVSHTEAAGKLLRSVGQSSKMAAADLALTLDYALDTVPFSTEAARVVLAISAGDFNSSRSELDMLHDKVLSSGVTLYTFSDYPTVDQRGRVYGLRADGLVFPESSAGEEYLDYPSRAGLLAKLAAATRGSAFQVQFVEAGLPAEFFSVVAEEIFAKVGKEARGCRECECDRGRAWSPVARCRPVGC